MITLEIALAFVLATLFCAAGIAKLFDVRGTKEMLSSLRFPGAVSAATATALPAVELVVGAGLLVSRTRLPAAIGAAALLTVFLAVVSWALSKGVKAQCQCFGRAHSKPLSHMTVVRIGAMLLGSTLLISMQFGAFSKLSPAAFNEVTAFLPWVAAIIAFLIVALQWRTMARLARRHAFALARIRLLEAEHDRHLRPTEATVPSGHDVTRSNSLCLVFVDENCNACEQLLSAPEPKLSSREGDPLVLVSAEPMSANWIERHSGGAPVLTDSGRRLATALNVRGTPTVVRIDLMVDAMIVAEGAPAAMDAIGNGARSESVSLGSR